jgi:glutathione synthase/RimK-type ligase-like ATP-grasp enzyme
MGSKSATILARELETRKVWPDRNYRPKRNHLILNWGNSQEPNWWQTMFRDRYYVLNAPSNVAVASNKHWAFQWFKAQHIEHPEWTTNIEEAKRWIEEGYKVVIRSTVTGHGGQGIIIAEEVEQLIHAPLYTKYFNGKREFRVHVFQNQVIDFSEKKRSREEVDGDALVRNHGNGWVFCREGIELPESVAEESKKSVQALGLDFGAVDVRLKERTNEVKVLEVNTAPGLEGTTIIRYIEAIKTLL